MSSVVNVKNLLDQELRPVLDAFELPTVDAEGVAAMRSASFVSPDLSDAVTRTDDVVPGDPPVPVRVHRPKDAEGLLPAIVTIHGGGYVIGSYDMDSPLLDRWCPALGVVGVSVDYRLAPETPYPGPLEDCYAALRWTYDNAAELGIDKDRIGIYGLSAGGGLAAALALLARDRGEVPLAFVAARLPDARRPPADPLHRRRTGSTCGARGRTSSAGAPISAPCTAPTTSRPTLPRPGRPTWPGSLRPAWSWAPSTASATRTSTTRNA